MITTALSPEFQAYLDELCANNDISSVAAERGISVKRSGNSYSCCCPFHAEKTPSCHLYPEDNHYHCFGCGAHGNVIKFLMQVENIDFMDAVEMLSNRAGMTIPRGKPKSNNKPKRFSNGGSFYGASNSRGSSYGVSDSRKTHSLSASEHKIKPENNSSGFSYENSAPAASEIPPDTFLEEPILPEQTYGYTTEILPENISETISEYPPELKPENVPPKTDKMPPEDMPYIMSENNSEYESGYSKKKRIYKMNEEAGRFFHNQLFSPEGKAGLDYLIRRGLSTENIRRFGLGYAADDYHKLHYYMKSLGYSDAELKEAALISTRDGTRFFDKFRNRVMFPVFDEQRRVIAFGGRTLSDDKRIPKYLNSDETPVFQKRKTLFALNYAKKSAADYFIICEGYMDVIAMHRAGFDSAVASLGTAITAEQAQLLSKRGKKKVVLSYDSDAAGQKATSRAIGLFMQTAFENVTVLKIEGAKDPDEFIVKYGAEPFKMLIENAEGAVKFEMERLSAGLKMNTPDDKNVFIRRAVRFMADIQDPAFRELCIENAAVLGDVSKKSVLDGVNDLISRKAPYHNSALPEKTAAYYKTRSDESGERGERSLKGGIKAETVILSYLFHNPDDIQKIEKCLPNGLLTEFGNSAYNFLLEKIHENSGECEISWLSEKFPDEMGRITDIANDMIYAYSEECFLEAVRKLSEIKRKNESVRTFAELGEYIQKKQEGEK